MRPTIFTRITASPLCSQKGKVCNGAYARTRREKLRSLLNRHNAARDCIANDSLSGGVFLALFGREGCVLSPLRDVRCACTNERAKQSAHPFLHSTLLNTRSTTRYVCLHRFDLYFQRTLSLLGKRIKRSVRNGCVVTKDRYTCHAQNLEIKFHRHNAFHIC